MATARASEIPARGEAAHGRTRELGRTPAQWYCSLAGLALLLAGALGFIADASFGTSATVDGPLQGGSFLGFEVNAWHNIVHLASGLLLLAAAPRRAPAKAIALLFGVTYGAVAVIGLIDGEDVLGLIPVNAADNVLHIALSALGILAGLASRGDDRQMHTSTAVGHPATGRRADTWDVVREIGRQEREARHAGGESVARPRDARGRTATSGSRSGEPDVTREAR